MNVTLPSGNPPVPPLSIGADPEFFVMRNGHYIPAHDFGCGTKREPMKTKNGFIQVDGLALECNVTPARTAREFLTNLQGVLGDLSEYVQKRDPLMSLRAQPAVLFGVMKIKQLPEEAQKLGCEPDWNAYTGKENDKPNEKSPWRTGSGHVHLGWTQIQYPMSMVHMNRCRSLVRQLDYYLGLPSLLWDKDYKRRELYGKAGSFRPKKYGLEYRVLSNKWVSSPKLAQYVFNQTKKAFATAHEGKFLDLDYKGLAKELIDRNDTNWVKAFPVLAEKIGVSW